VHLGLLGGGRCHGRGSCSLWRCGTVPGKRLVPPAHISGENCSLAATPPQSGDTTAGCLLDRLPTERERDVRTDFGWWECDDFIGHSATVARQEVPPLCAATTGRTSVVVRMALRGNDQRTSVIVRAASSLAHAGRAAKRGSAPGPRPEGAASMRR
jgi:hypothetical protein